MEPASTEFEQYMLEKSIDTEMAPLDETLLEKYICAETDPSNETSSKGEKTIPTFYNLKVACYNSCEMLSGNREYIKNNLSSIPDADTFLGKIDFYYEVLVLDQSGEIIARTFYARNYWGVCLDWEKGIFFDKKRLVSLMDSNAKTVDTNNSKINIIYINYPHSTERDNTNGTHNLFTGIKALKPRMVRFKDLNEYDDDDSLKECISGWKFPCHIYGGLFDELFKEHNRKANVALCEEFKKYIRTVYDQMSLDDLKTKPYLDLPQDVKNILVHIKAPDVLIERDFCLAKIATRNTEYTKALKIYNNIPRKIESQYSTKYKSELAFDILQLQQDFALNDEDKKAVRNATRNGEHWKAVKIYSDNIQRKTESQYSTKYKSALTFDMSQLKWEITKRVCIECVSMLLSLETKNCSYTDLVERYTYVYQYISYLDQRQHADYDVNIFLRLLGKQDNVELSRETNELSITWGALYEQVPDHIDQILVDIIGHLKRNNKLNFYFPAANNGLNLVASIPHPLDIVATRSPRIFSLSIRDEQALNTPKPILILLHKDITINFLQWVLKKKYRNSPSELKQSDGNSNLKQERFQQLESQMEGMKRTLDNMQRMMKNIVDKISNSPQPSDKPPKKRLKLNGER